MLQPGDMRKFFLLLPLFCIGMILPVYGAVGDPAGVVQSSPPADMAVDELDDDFEDDYADESNAVIIADPLEPVNRAIFWFNDKLYFYLLKPVARGYRIVPVPVRQSVSKFFSNIYTPVRFVNSTLQLKFRDAGTELLRFGINTTVGILGLFDPARNYWHIQKKREDFGQTLGHYGIGQGLYLVLPFFGPSSLRDGVGLFLDGRYLDPVFLYIGDFWLRTEVRGFKLVNGLSLDKDTYESIKRDALDPYAFIKNAYVQKRAGLVRK